jgi:hypothetical protein
LTRRIRGTGTPFSSFDDQPSFYIVRAGDICFHLRHQFEMDPETDSHIQDRPCCGQTTQSKAIPIKMFIENYFMQYLYGDTNGLGFFVGPIGGSERLKYTSNRQNSLRDTQLFSRQSTR